MGKYIINGGSRLKGDIYIQGSKNSALAILIATMITDGETVLTNIPDIADVRVCIDILRHYGVSVQYCGKTTVVINTKDIFYNQTNSELNSKMRASSYLLSALLSRFGKSELPESGGCDLGKRPLDLHINALTLLGAVEENGMLTSNKGLKGSIIDFKSKTVGGTVNAIISAAKADGVTIIKNAAREPHIRDLACFLNHCGAEIIGAGSDKITVVGKKSLHGCRYQIDADMIEAGTMLIASLVTGGKIRCNNAPIDELGSFIDFLRRSGAEISYNGSTVTAVLEKLYPTDIITAPYPAFPTDLQPQACVLLGLANGKSSITETVFESRFAYTTELSKAGLLASISNNTLNISGIQCYHSSHMNATDLRGGVAMVLAALNAKGKSIITNTELIERGYSDFTERLSLLGADIKKVD